MTFISEKSIYDISAARGEGVETRLDSILHSYFWTWDCTYIGKRYSEIGIQLLFKKTDYSLVLSVPLSAFQTPAYARVLIQRQRDFAEAERRHAQETEVVA